MLYIRCALSIEKYGTCRPSSLLELKNNPIHHSGVILSVQRCHNCYLTYLIFFSFYFRKGYTNGKILLFYVYVFSFFYISALLLFYIYIHLLFYIYVLLNFYVYVTLNLYISHIVRVRRCRTSCTTQTWQNLQRICAALQNHNINSCLRHDEEQYKNASTLKVQYLLANYQNHYYKYMKQHPSSQTISCSATN